MQPGDSGRSSDCPAATSEHLVGCSPASALQWPEMKFLWDAECLGFRGSGFRVQGLGFRFSGVRFRVQGLGFRVCRVSVP